MSTHLSLAVPAYKLLQARASDRQAKARARGTELGRQSSVRSYLKFCRRMSINPHRPVYQDICCWIEDLAGHALSPATIRNKVSHLRVHATLVGISVKPMNHPRVARALDALDRDKNYTHRKTDAIPVAALKLVILALPPNPIGTAIRAAILIMYHAALRQSEVLPPSIARWESTKHPTRGDIKITTYGLSMRVKWAKNMQGYRDCKSVQLATTQDSRFCVVQTLQQHMREAPTQNPKQPLIVFPGSTRPIPISLARRLWIKANKLAALHSKGYTMHSVRRAAATEAHRAGCQEIDIQAYGGWSSNAHRRYIKSTRTTAVNAAISQALNP